MIDTLLTKEFKMTEKEKAIAIIKNIIGYNGVGPWGRALHYAVKQLEEKLHPTTDNIQEDIWKVCKDHNHTLVQTGIYGSYLRMKVSQQQISPYDALSVTGWDDEGNTPIDFALCNIDSYTMEKTSQNQCKMTITFKDGNEVILIQ